MPPAPLIARLRAGDATLGGDDGASRLNGYDATDVASLAEGGSRTKAMNDSSRDSAAIERMRLARNLPTCENRTTWTPSAGPMIAPQPIRIHPRLRRRWQLIARLMGLRNAREILAVLEDIQTLLVRCGYHLELLRSERRWERNQAKRAYRHAALRHARRRRGRPVDGVNLAYHQLGLGLAAIWATHTGRAPTRHVPAVGDESRCSPFAKRSAEHLSNAAS